VVHYQLRDLWATGHAQIQRMLSEQAQQREERERRQFMADLNRQIFERSQQARANCAQAERVAAEVRAMHVALKGQLAKSRSWWLYFRRRDLTRRLVVSEAEVGAAEAQLKQAREQLVEIEEQGGAKFPGLSLHARRTLNLMAIACAQLQALRLTPQSLLSRCLGAMSRSEPQIEGAGDAAAALAMIQEVARARSAMLKGSAELQPEVRRLADHLAAQARFVSESQVLPDEDSVQAALRLGLSRGETMNWNLLSDDLWSVSDLFYGSDE
jgi:hypothetical protein